MKDDPSDSLWLPPLSLVVIGLLIGLISFADPIVPFSVTGQALGLVLILRGFCYWPPMIRWVAAMPPPHRVVFGLVLGSMMLGHYTLASRTYFPFVAWEIFPFVNEHDPVTCDQFLATTQSGKKVRLITEQLFPSVVQTVPLGDLANPDLYPPGTVEGLAHVLAKAYNQSHADPIAQVDLVVMAVQLHPPANESRAEPSCQLLQRYDISSAR